MKCECGMEVKVGDETCPRCGKLHVGEWSALPTCSAADRITKLEDMLFERGAMNEPPCFCCGYNGPGYYQPSTHPCAERHHRLSR